MADKGSGDHRTQLRKLIKDGRGEGGKRGGFCLTEGQEKAELEGGLKERKLKIPKPTWGHGSFPKG